ncbi:putative glutamine amidotransferase [Clostridium saccharoperbutylacetonicum]|uniref:Putative glutamine amidotransferase n=1 Tax=Clostridium saccharoperbutylacetonicum N1-4(HMT) TaxID=931276 RepID=M1LTG5_9CLOT|nr:gamma-glutamyl-gamma-aminobutyrate hydrolase family protein [Clostridium saccharoperbutylacetonicum]AGF56305.1 putative glutamine amidotransferase [Clostridium saccharoperbutylacetonicum N1-4(HMT)]NRT62951.1 putative glutamine amidotransferase [Clostridium saccharoperbutylacetonicum]NSB26308.1 putative glutamine amidotransferase [Clostridium saccharoperbutylacetonicum]NSB45659.1 putative glutamine amidotransferase [Clostridium saccharoperbutylacetonicum]
MKPIIGITTMHEIEIEKSFTLASNNYLRAVEAAGGVPLFLPITEELEDIKSYLNIIDGIVFTGGEDISPLKYGENPLQIEFIINNSRDNFEFNLFLEAYNMDMPILGICRGAQLINVALGGSLYQDINLQFSNCHGHMQSEMQVYDFFHEVIVDKDSKLFDIFKSRELEVNSFHKQAIKALGDNLKVTATAKDGIIEGIEGISRKFLVGVQWHPEDLSLKHKDFVNLFKALIDNV